MADETGSLGSRISFGIWVASVLGIVLILMITPQTRILIPTVLGTVIVVIFLVTFWRAMRAHERLADATERLAQQNEKKL